MRFELVKLPEGKRVKIYGTRDEAVKAQAAQTAKGNATRIYTVGN